MNEMVNLSRGGTMSRRHGDYLARGGPILHARGDGEFNREP